MRMGEGVGGREIERVVFGEVACYYRPAKVLPSGSAVFLPLAGNFFSCTTLFTSIALYLRPTYGHSPGVTNGEKGGTLVDGG